MNAAARVRREKVRIQAAGMFEESRSTTQIASELRVTEKSVRDWRRRWAAGGADALASTGPGGSDCKLSADQQKQLAEMLDDGPLVHGWDDARWTLARVAELIERCFGVSYTLRGVSYLLHRMGYSQQVPTRRAIERDREAIASWHRRRWPSVRGWRRRRVPGSASRTRRVRSCDRR
ncbi:winged helix-turn-helix domain-containing protein [Micromonospora sp. KC721]|nr:MULTISPECIES: winged helix-turn-helix domain-containing protein [unclassified Micromonospora]